MSQALRVKGKGTTTTCEHVDEMEHPFSVSHGYL